MTNGQFAPKISEEAHFLLDKVATRLTGATSNAPSSKLKSICHQKYAMPRGPKLPPRRLRAASRRFLRLAHAIILQNHEGQNQPMQKDLSGEIFFYPAVHPIYRNTIYDLQSVAGIRPKQVNSCLTLCLIAQRFFTNSQPLPDSKLLLK